MYELNLTEYGSMPYPPFDNSTPLHINGVINGTPANFTTSGYVNAVCEVRGMDLMLELVEVIVIFLVAILCLMIWQHYTTTWGGRKHL